MVSKIVDNWLKEHNIFELTSVQKKAIPIIQSGENVLITAPTGYGKTLAVIIPIFEKILELGFSGLSVIYIAPTKSLNRDILKNVFDFAKRLGLTIAERHGDISSYERSKQSKSPPNILITTPESLQSLLISERMKRNLSMVKYVIIDEIHELVSSKRGSQLTLGLERLENFAKFSRIGISATIADLNEVGKFLCGYRNFQIVEVSEIKESKVEVLNPDVIPEDLILAKKFRISQKLSAIMRCMKKDIESSERVIIFVNTRQQSEVLSHHFKNAFPDLALEVHHSSLSKKQRVSVEDALKNGSIKALIATSSMELGIDVGSIDLIIQFLSPRQVSKLVQRMGRSGHVYYKESRCRIYTMGDDDYLESCAIKDLMVKGYLEKPIIPINSLDVLAHQVIGLLKDNKYFTIDEMCSIINKSYCFKMQLSEFERFLEFMQRLNYLTVEDSHVFLSKRAFFYYFKNVSTIPNIKTFDVVNVETNTKIGTLDDAFVMQYCDTNANIIMRGEPWTVLEVKEDVVNVGRSRSFSAAIPSWVGELIPVSVEVAKEAGRLRHSFYDEADIVSDDKKYFVEGFENNIILHSLNGSKINNTLGIIFSSLLSVSENTSVGLRVDPYRVILTLPHANGLNDFKTMLSRLNSEMASDIVRISVKNSTMFQTRFFNVGQRFGVINRDAEYIGSRISKIVEAYINTPIFEETLNEVMREKMDVEGAKKVINELKGRLVFSDSRKISVLGYEGLQVAGFGGILRSDESYEEIYDLVKERLLNKEFYFQCTNCNNRLGIFSVNGFPYEKCPRCGAKTIGFVHVSKKDDKKTLEETSNLFLTYGKKSCFVLAGYGVGPKVGARILSRMTTEKELLKDIIEAEKTFVRTRRFWN
ncbi:ATP-dependent DNA helicase Hel308 [Candidatus Tiddalikarchaeum anstoanum]|nr:ATP-dependent DNA helicase Hel308 [Candidatus Tiddalikarchaeum anstoanum]